jgi:hypothetical protein
MRYLIPLAIVLLMVSSCARIPEPVGYEYTTQEKMQAAHHWNVLAKDLSNRINNELIRSDFLNTPIFVKETCGNDSLPCPKGTTSEFNEGFRDLLITELVHFGIPTSAVQNKEAITVDYKVQLVRHNTNRLRTVQPGFITALTTAIMVFRNATPEALGLVAAGGVDYVNSSYARKTDIEAIITTSMVFKNKYFFRSSDIYYINNADYHHYQNDKGTAKEIRLTSSQPM